MLPNIKDKFLVIGSSGQVASALKEIGDERYHFVGRPEFDIQNEESLKQLFVSLSPALVINCSAYTAVDLAEVEQEQAYAINGTAVKNLALLCRQYKVPLIHISTDYVFDGSLDRPYLETDQTSPLSVYGKSKLAGEDYIREILSEYIILRTSWVFSKYGHNFVKTMVKLSETKPELNIVSDQIGCPTAAHNIAAVVHKLAGEIARPAKNMAYGTYNYTDSPAVSWYEFAGIIFEMIKTKYNKKIPVIKPIFSSEYKTAATRPLNSRLDCSLIEKNFGIKSQNWHYHLKECVEKFIQGSI